MSISQAMSRPLRVVGRSSGKHAMPRGSAQSPRAAVQQETGQQETGQQETGQQETGQQETGQQEAQPDKRHRPKHAAVPRQRAAA